MRTTILECIRCFLILAIVVCIGLLTMFMFFVRTNMDAIKVIQKEFRGQCVMDVSDVLNSENINKFLGCVVSIFDSTLTSDVVINRDIITAYSRIATATLHLDEYVKYNNLTAMVIINYFYNILCCCISLRRGLHLSYQKQI